MRSGKKILFYSILLLFISIAIRRPIFLSFSENLHGVYETEGLPVLSINKWFKGTFQEQFTRFLEDLPGMRGAFIRIRNQYDFTLFSIPHARKIVMGKKGYLFGEENIDSYNGLDFAGTKYLDVKVSELKQLQDELWNRKKILLMVIFTPDKATFFPELIPDRLIKKRQTQSNYHYYSRKCVETGINLIDFNRYFLLIKDTVKYPLFAKTGAHWSSYGAMIAADSMMHYIEKKLIIRLPELVVKDLETSHTARDYDDDISNTMNLFWKIIQPALAYPKICFLQKPGTIRPSALFIGDSYYWNWYRPGYIRNLFNNTEFWYYDKEVYPQSFFKTMNRWQVDLVKTIERQKVIILMQTSNGKERDFGYGFVDRTWPEYDTSATNRIRNIERILSKAPENMAIYKQKATTLNAPLKEVIRADAIYAGNNLLLKKK